ncbi:MAG: hypothetical protein ABIK28_05425 [Planctomycetota bacterium]
MAADSEKFKDFDNLDNKDGDELEDITDNGFSEGEQASSGEIEAFESIIDEAPEMQFSKEAQEAKAQEEVHVKYCIFCREIIPVEAIACKHCGHVLHIFEGAVFKQLYWFFWGGVIAFVGAFLPFFNGDASSLVPATHTFTGAIHLILSILFITAMGMSIYSKRMIMSSVFLMFIPAAHTWLAVVQQVGKIEAPDFHWYQLFYQLDALNLLTGSIGSGMLLIWIGSTIVVLTFILSIVGALSGGGNKDKKAQRGNAKAKGRKR